MAKYYKALLVLLSIGILILSCKEDAPINPFDIQDDLTDTLGGDTSIYASNSLIGLQKNVFEPTCANSGCHDGTFEPDFRTIESTYNTLIYHPIIKNNPAGDFSFRVVPFAPEESVLYERLLRDIDGQSGIMPLESLDSDWDDNKELYIQDVRQWIANGAPDVFGNTYQEVDENPVVLGLRGFEQSVQLVRGDAGNGPLLMDSASTEIELQFSLDDDRTSPASLQGVKAIFARGPEVFDEAVEIDLNYDPSGSAPGFTGDVVDYNYSATLNLSSDTLFNVGRFYLRTILSDGVNMPIEVPTSNSPLYLKRYYSVVKI